MERGLVHLYTGDGKGKTTAAIGLAVRAAGCGKQVGFVQFLKSAKTGEQRSLRQLEHITVLENPQCCPFLWTLDEAGRAELAETCAERLAWALAEYGTVGPADTGRMSGHSRGRTFDGPGSIHAASKPAQRTGSCTDWPCCAAGPFGAGRLSHPDAAGASSL